MSTILSKEFAFGQLEGAKQFLNQLNLNEKLWFITKGNVAKATGASIAGLILIYLGKIWYSYRFFKKRGIKTPKIEFFFGNYRQLNSKNYSESLRDWTKEFGKTYGYFEGHSPVLVTSDLDIIQEIFIKQSSSFSGRKRGPITGRDSAPNHNLFTSSSARWKRMRNIMNPTFSSAKLRDLSPLIIKCIDRLNEKFKLTEGKEIDVTDYLKRFTMDSIWNCAFGVDVNLQFDKSKDEYLTNCESIFKSAVEKNLLIYFGTYLHEFKYLLLDFLMLLNSIASGMSKNASLLPFFWLRDTIIEIVETRQKEKIPRKDYLQLILDAETTEKLTDLEKNEVDYSSAHLDKKLSIEEIKTNLVLFLLAGYETTSTALSFACFTLAKHPEEQAKLYDEIISMYPEDSNAEPDYDSVKKLQYLDMFVNEVLRMYSIGNIAITRRCTKATNIKGIDFPVDTDITIDALSLHYDPELWGPVDPNQFYPSRFAPEHKRNPLAFVAFGLGPRNCIGMKFALQELKFSLVKLLKKFEIVAGPNFPEKLEIKEGAVRSPKDGVPVILKPRDI